MANEKTKTTAASSEPAKRKTMLGAFAPAGKTEADVVVTNQLLPQYLGGVYLERLADKVGKKIKDIQLGKASFTDEELESITPIVGTIDRVEILPIQKRNVEGQKDFAPFSLIIRDLKTEVLCFRGSEEEREDVIVKPGEDALFAISSNSSVDRILFSALQDLENLYMFAARPTGYKKLAGKPEPMVTFSTEILRLDDKRISRGASWALPPWYVVVTATGALTGSIRNKEHMGLLHVHSTDGIDCTAKGDVINRKTGELLARLGPNGSVLPPERQIAPTDLSPAPAPSQPS